MIAISRLLNHRWRFAHVLAASLLLAVAQPLMADMLDDQGSFDVFFSLLLGAILLLVFEKKEHRRIAVLLSAVALAGIWLGHASGGSAGRVLLVASHLLAACFMAFALYGIVCGILANQVSGDAIFGAACGYLLLGIAWSLIYYAVETAVPNSFNGPATASGHLATTAPHRGTLSYYSFITLATVGYGDVTPATPLARTLAWMEAITGQFYLAVLVSALVGFKVAQVMKR
jgi:voltage-gated potassium channel